MAGPFSTPVLLLVFNRPETTARVFDAIRHAKPSRLYIAADGPREGRQGENQRVALVRKIVTAVDWPCEVQTLFREKNLGCKIAISSAITWFFEKEEQGIILEDDCLPHPDFFGFCETLLHKYADDERVFMISGNNFQHGQKRGDASYYFSRYSHIWGWASWRRAWSNYDVGIQFWPEWQASDEWKLKFQSSIERRYFAKHFNQVHNNLIDTWDYQWLATLLYRDGLSITPNSNLVSNIGFGEGATHTTSANSAEANIAVEAIGDISHPTEVTPNLAADSFVFDNTMGGRAMRFPRNIIYAPKDLLGLLYRKLQRLLIGTRSDHRVS